MLDDFLFVVWELIEASEFVSYKFSCRGIPLVARINQRAG
jgi:hypothetical protein